VLYTTLVWIGIAAFVFTTFCGMYILGFLPEIPASEGGKRAPDAHRNRRGVALGATSLIFLGMSLWRNRDMATVSSPRPSSIDPR